ncbi:hypothetical protein [Armatimonas rosea]|uniref:NolW-like domain-containing protein n=1 Tax=Armatimonas rosea TaxID=685828 RepID=A0A7W9SPU4_ARMRO|nr:hypothetical protein [Armatimonas rosea]MBB6049989.1 hypothetical protein [Armatimonas rosea]
MKTLYSVPGAVRENGLEVRLRTILLVPQNNQQYRTILSLTLGATTLALLLSLRPYTEPVIAAPSPAKHHDKKKFPTKSGEKMIPSTAIIMSQEKANLVTFELRYLSGTELIKKLERQIPKGITKLEPDDSKNMLQAQGTPEALNALKILIKRLDVEYINVELKIRRVQQGKTVSDVRIPTAEGTKGTITISPDSLSVTVSKVSHDKKNISLIVEYNQLKAVSKIIPLGKETQIVLPDNSELFVTATIAKNGSVEIR